MIQGLSHMTFVVRDLDRMEEILTTVVGARKVYDSGAGSHSLSRERFFVAGGAPVTATLRRRCGSPSWRAKGCQRAATITSPSRLPTPNSTRRSHGWSALGLDVREGRSRIPGEGRSIYFHDDDNHLFELHTGTLATRLARYAAEAAITRRAVTPRCADDCQLRLTPASKVHHAGRKSTAAPICGLRGSQCLRAGTWHSACREKPGGCRRDCCGSCRCERPACRSCRHGAPSTRRSHPGS